MLIDIYGLIVKCETQPPELAAELTRPFKYFYRNHGAPDIVLRVHKAEPPHETLPALDAEFSTDPEVVYKDNDQTIIDYPGMRAAIIVNRQRSAYTLYGMDRTFLQENFFRLMMSLLENHCDIQGMLAVRALAVSLNNTAILITLPPDAEEPAFQYPALPAKRLRLISNALPLVNPKGHVIPAPVHLGFRDEAAVQSIPPQFIVRYDTPTSSRRGHITWDYWQKRLETRSLEHSIVVLASRRLSGEPVLNRCSRSKAAGYLMRDAVLRVGRNQSLAVGHHNWAWNQLHRMYTVFKRFRPAAKLIRSSEFYRLYLSRDDEKNTACIKPIFDGLV